MDKYITHLIRENLITFPNSHYSARVSKSKLLRSLKSPCLFNIIPAPSPATPIVPPLAMLRSFIVILVPSASKNNQNYQNNEQANHRHDEHK